MIRACRLGSDIARTQARFGADRLAATSANSGGSAGVRDFLVTNPHKLIWRFPPVAVVLLTMSQAFDWKIVAGLLYRASTSPVLGGVGFVRVRTSAPGLLVPHRREYQARKLARDDVRSVSLISQ